MLDPEKKGRLRSSTAHRPFGHLLKILLIIIAGNRIDKPMINAAMRNPIVVAIAGLIPMFSH